MTVSATVPLESFTPDVWWAASQLSTDEHAPGWWHRSLDLAVPVCGGVLVVGVCTVHGEPAPLVDVPMIDMTPGDVAALGAALCKLAEVLEVLPATRDT